MKERCEINEFSSRMCELGTKCCIVQHSDLVARIRPSEFRWTLRQVLEKSPHLLDEEITLETSIKIQIHGNSLTAERQDDKWLPEATEPVKGPVHQIACNVVHPNDDLCETGTDEDVGVCIWCGSNLR